jgi:hypothetical protein
MQTLRPIGPGIVGQIDNSVRDRSGGVTLNHRHSQTETRRMRQP